MNILDRIIAHKQAEVAERKQTRPVAVLEQSPFFSRETYSLKRFLADDSKTGIIPEFKRRSPSKGIINAAADVLEVTKRYTQQGASGLSVLTDADFFGGSADDLQKARINPIPILRKDFIIDEYQVTEARAMGADVILLIAACLTARRVEELASFAKSLSLEVLLEIHDDDELGHICADIGLVGVNNRNLKTFEVDISRSIALSRKMPAEVIRIAESGIDRVETIQTLKEAGFNGFLVGERFMKEPDPGMAFADFVQKLK